MKMSDKDLAELQEQSYRERTQDGVNSLFSGIFYLSISLGIWARIMPLQMAPIVLLTSFLLVVLLLPFTKRLRERYVYPRTGYVQYHGPEPLMLAATVLSVFFAIIITVALLILWYGSSFNLEAAYRFTSLFVGLVAIGPSAVFARRTGAHSYWLQGIFMSITGFAFVVTDFGDPLLGFVFYMLLWSGIMTLLGLVRLIRFIRKYPIIELEEVS